MRHLKPFHIFESRDDRQMLVLYYISPIELRDTSSIPHRYDMRGARALFPTYYMIQDAVRDMEKTQNPKLYQLNMRVSVASEREFEEFLLQRGYDPEEFIESITTEDKIPDGMDSDDFSDLRWAFDGIECGDRVMLFDPYGRVDILRKVQDSEIERVKAKI